MDLEQRVQALERELQELRAERSRVQTPFEVVTAGGQVVFTVFEDEGYIGVSAFRSDGERFLDASSNSEETWLNLHRGDTNPALVLLASQDESGIAVIGASGEVRGKLSVVGEVTSLVIYHTNGTPAGVLMTTPNGTSLFSLLDSDGDPGMVTTVGPENQDEIDKLLRTILAKEKSDAKSQSTLL